MVHDDRVEWERSRDRIAPGQSLVFYDGDLVVGGAIAT
ncbi:MAG: aminomethyltransferase beta-barrel domain-containing protein [Acidimicrobiales bacterium]